jgi:maltose/moltooligosaccharide transporter
VRKQKPTLGFWQIWNMCFGFLGIQFGFALQNANVSRIFQSLGASIDELPILWLAAPVTGLVVQPIIGYLSDRTWGRLGRRRPYFLVGALLATAALVVMPNSPYLWIAAGMLWILDASINISMEPFRALVGDMLPDRQRCRGYSMQSWFIGVGAVVASALPWILTNAFDVANVAEPGQLPQSVKLAFYLGAAAFLGAVLWTIFSTREYSPAQLAEFEAQVEDQAGGAERHAQTPGWYRKSAAVWIVVGAAFAAAVAVFGWDKQLYVLGCGLVAFGLLQIIVASRQQRGATDGMLHTVINDLYLMPQVMRQLAVVQFLSWFALFAMWIYTTAAVTEHHYGTTDAASAAYNEGANWVGILFAAYNGFARWPHCSSRSSPKRSAVARRPGLPLVRCARPGLDPLHRRPATAAGVDDRRRHRLGFNSVAAVRDAVAGGADEENGNLHGDLQFLHRDPADSRGQRARYPGARAVRRSQHQCAGARRAAAGPRRAGDPARG